MSIGAKIESHADEVIAAARAARARALEKVGLTAEKHAKDNLTKFPRVDTGWLRNSISHVSGEGAAYIGTNVDYAVYVEVGTGIYASDGRGRKTPWVYMDDEGNYHVTRGMEASHFLKNAAEGHKDEYRQIIKNEFKG